MADTLPSRTSTTPARPIGGAPGDLARTVGAMMLQWSNVIALVLLIVVSSMLSPYFLETRNLFNVLRGASIIGIVSIGMTFVILNRGIDLSVGSIVGVATATTALLAPYGFGFAVGAALVLSSLVGVVNGLIITRLKLQPFIATLAMLIFARGAVYIYTDGNNIIVRDAPAWFSFIGSGHIGSVPVPIVLFFAVWAISLYVQKNTRFGRYIFAVGANEDASRLYGIHVDRIKLGVYTISGFLSGLAGVILVSRLLVAEPNAGQLYELEAIAATLIGGTTFDGGIGGVGGTILGVLIMSLLGNILNLTDVSPYFQMLLQGLIIIVAVVVSEARQRRR